jgi:hypothetical protein
MMKIRHAFRGVFSFCPNKGGISMQFSAGKMSCFRTKHVLYLQDEDKYQFGKNKLFFRAGQVSQLTANYPG